MHVAVSGAGDLGATLVRRLAESGGVRKITLVDPDEGRARGKALDIVQSGPLEDFDTEVIGRADLNQAAPFDVLVVADPVAPATAHESVKERIRDIVSFRRDAFLLFAGADAPAWIEAAADAGVPRDSMAGSAALAFTAALRRHVAQECECGIREVGAAVWGRPPEHAVVTQATLTCGGVPLAQRSPALFRRWAAAIAHQRLGPLALASAAAYACRAVMHPQSTVLPLFALLQGEYGHRGVALAVPVRVGAGRVQDLPELVFEPAERVAFDNAAQRRWAESR